MVADEKLWEIKNYLFIYMYSLRSLFFTFPNYTVPILAFEFLKINWFPLIIYCLFGRNGDRVGRSSVLNLNRK